MPLHVLLLASLVPWSASVVAQDTTTKAAQGTSLERPGDGSPLRGTWDLHAIEVAEAEDPIAALREGLGGRGLRVSFDASSVGRVRHGIMNRRLTLEVYTGRLSRGRIAKRHDLCWIDPSRLTTKAVSGATHKVRSAVRSAC